MAREPRNWWHNSVVRLNHKLQELVGGTMLLFFFLIFVIYYIYLANKSSNHIHCLEITTLIREKKKEKIPTTIIIKRLD
jgi:hypothetical protein